MSMIIIYQREGETDDRNVLHRSIHIGASLLYDNILRYGVYGIII